MVTREITLHLLRLGSNVAVCLPERTARNSGLLPGSPVRVILLDEEIRVRRASAPRAYDLETLEEYQERRAKLDLTED